MRLHLIVLSTFMAALICGCGGPAPVVKTQKATPDPIREMLPDDELETVLFKNAAKREAEALKDDDRNAKIERQWHQQVKAAEHDHDVPGEVRALVQLGKLYLYEKRLHDALQQFEQATACAQKPGGNDQLRAYALAQLGEAEVRMQQLDQAIKHFDEADKIVKAPNEFLETHTRFQLRQAWVLHGLGKDAAAKELLAKAKQNAAKEGKQSASYHVALAQEAVLAMDSGDQKTADNLTQEFFKLPKPKADDAEFGDQLLKSCARTCRNKGKMDEEDYLDDKCDYFSKIVKLSQRQAHRHNAT